MEYFIVTGSCKMLACKMWAGGEGSDEGFIKEYFNVADVKVSVLIEADCDDSSFSVRGNANDATLKFFLRKVYYIETNSPGIFRLFSGVKGHGDANIVRMM